MSRKKADAPYRGNLSALDTLFGSDPASVGELVALTEITVPKGQPRKYFDEAALAQLAASVRERGVLQPLLVRPSGRGLELVAGERRYRAAKMAGLSEIPVVVKDVSDAEAAEIALVENLQREDLNPVEETEGILALLSRRLDVSQDTVVSLLNRAANAKRGFTDNDVRNEAWDQLEATFDALGTLTPESFRSHRLPLLSMPDDVIEALRAGKLEYTKARLLAKIEDNKTRQGAIQKVVDESLSVKAVSALVTVEQGSRAKPSDLVSEVKRQLSQKRVAALPDDKRKKLDKLLKEIETLLKD